MLGGRWVTHAKTRCNLGWKASGGGPSTSCCLQEQKPGFQGLLFKGRSELIILGGCRNSDRKQQQQWQMLLLLLHRGTFLALGGTVQRMMGTQKNTGNKSSECACVWCMTQKRRATAADDWCTASREWVNNKVLIMSSETIWMLSICIQILQTLHFCTFNDNWVLICSVTFILTWLIIISIVTSAKVWRLSVGLAVLYTRTHYWPRWT